MIAFDYDASAATLRCALKGRMDTQRSDEMGKILNSKLAEIKEGRKDAKEPLKVVFDLKEVDYVSSGFLRLCLSTAKGLEKGQFSIINTDPFVKKIFKVAELEETLNVT